MIICINRFPYLWQRKSMKNTHSVNNTLQQCVLYLVAILLVKRMEREGLKTESYLTLLYIYITIKIHRALCFYTLRSHNRVYILIHINKHTYE